METVTVTSKPMDGVSYRETNKQDSIGKIHEKNITGIKQVIDEQAVYNADPSKSRIYG